MKNENKTTVILHDDTINNSVDNNSSSGKQGDTKPSVVNNTGKGPNTAQSNEGKQTNDTDIDDSIDNDDNIIIVDDNTKPKKKNKKPKTPVEKEKDNDVMISLIIGLAIAIIGYLIYNHYKTEGENNDA